MRRQKDRPVTETNQQGTDHKKRHRRFRHHKEVKEIDYKNLVVNLSARSLTDYETKLLALGLSFCPTNKIPVPKDTIHEVLRFDRKVRLSHHFRKYDNEQNTKFVTSVEPVTLMNYLLPPKDKSFTPNAGINPQLDIFLSTVKTDIVSHQHQLVHHNLDTNLRQALKDIRSDGSIIIKPADKGGAVVIMDKTQYIDKAETLLNDKRHYRRVYKDFTEEYTDQIAEYIKTKVGIKELSKEVGVFVTPIRPRTPIFYILPKIHKVNAPGRPIVSAVSGPTDNLSRFIDNILRPLVPLIPSYIKDTSHILQKLRSLGHIPTHAILCTMDVSSLYTNIPHQEGVTACLRAIEHSDLQHLPPLEIISYLMRTILERNCFEFNNKFYLQVTGTAMGTAMAPSYANLFMGELEIKLLQASPTQPYVWYRYIDDIFFIWLHSPIELQKFVTFANSFHPTIKFTMESSTEKIAFLDLNICLDMNQVYTTTYHKPTDAHSYLHYKSNHPAHQKKGIPYSQFLRMVRNCTFMNDAQYSINKLFQHFLQRGYPRTLLNTQKNKALAWKQEDLLYPKSELEAEEDGPLIYINNYHPAGPKVKSILDSHKPVLQQHPHTRHISKFMVAFRRPQNLRDILVHSGMKTPKKNGIYKCGTPRCTGCKHIDQGITFSDKHGKSYPILGHIDCNTSYVIYLLTCRKCRLQYVGQTSNYLKKRIYQHIRDVRDPKAKTTIATHFRLPNHNENDVRVSVITLATRVTSERLLAERAWIAVLNTTLPSGLNVQT